MSEHELKAVQPFFDAVWSGEKTCELRRDNRGFQIGDVLQLREYDREKGFLPRTVVVQITHIVRLLKQGWIFPTGYFDVVLSFSVLAREGG